MTDSLLEELREARRARTSCALVTVAATRGSVPREAGSKMLVFAGGKTSGTIGGGKFEALIIEESLAVLSAKAPLLKTYPLHEGCADSFGAICGGEVTVFIEPQRTGEAIFLIGAGHCARAMAKLATEASLHVTVWADEGTVVPASFPESVRLSSSATAPEFITNRQWSAEEALILVSRNHELDAAALAAALANPGAGYLGMIGSRRKVAQVFERMKARGFNHEHLARVHAPIGLDIGADSPAEIAISVLAEILQVLRRRSGKSLSSAP